MGYLGLVGATIVMAAFEKDRSLLMRQGGVEL